jgi:hypothetical protein
MATVPEQYTTIAPWLGALPGWVPEVEQTRIAAYDKYEEIYWSSEEGFVEVMRGDNDNPVFMPTARILVNTVNRYTAPGFGWRVQPLVDPAAEPPAEGALPVVDQNVLIAQLAFDQLFAREQFISKFNSAKLKGIRRGDWLFHVIADDTKPLGKRIKIMVVHPSAYFPVYESDLVVGGDTEKLIRVHLAEQVRVDNQDKVNRLTYERLFDASGVQTGIQVSQGVFSLQDWAKGDSKPERTIISAKLLPPSIPAIPVYHLKNIDSTDRYGSSELRGSESVLLGINQTISDEDLTLAMDGIGVYATSGGPPVDAQGNTSDWIMGPGRVLSNAPDLRRVSGAGSVAPYGDHYDRLVEAVKQAAGISDVAIGKVDSATAESGIALLIQLGPILAYTQDKDQHILDVMGQMFYDLCFWLTEYEELPLIGTGEAGTPSPVILVQPTIREKIPTNRKEVFDRVIALRSMIPPLISIPTALDMLREIGMVIPEGEAEAVDAEQAAAATALLGDASLIDTTITDRTASEVA